jgi:hypothetical protein
MSSCDSIERSSPRLKENQHRPSVCCILFRRNKSILVVVYYPSLLPFTMLCSTITRNATAAWTIVAAFLLSLIAVANGDSSYIIHTYQASITSLSALYDVSGYVILFTKEDGNAASASEASPYVAYTGQISNIESGLTYETCNFTNGCGVHIHSGTSCTNTTTQGGHYYKNGTNANATDPWINERYFTNDDGVTSDFSNVLEIGTADIEGHAFIGTSPLLRQSFVTHCSFPIVYRCYIDKFTFIAIDLP